LQPNDVAVLTEKTKITKDQGNYLFENNFAFVTPEGEVKLKENKLFEERIIATVDPESLEEQIEILEAAFSGLEESFSSFFKEFSESGEMDYEELKSKAGQLIDDAKSATAIGDFEKLISSANKKLEEIGRKQVEENHIQSAGEDAAADIEEQPEAVKSEVEAEDVKPGNNESTVETDDKEPNVAETLNDAEKTETSEDEDTDESDGGTVASEEITVEHTAKASVQDEVSDDESPENYYRKLADKAETLSEITDWAYATMEFENIELQWNDGPDAEGADLKQYREKIDKLRQELDEKKRAHYEEQKKIREKNLEKKKDLLKQLKQIIDEEKWTLTREISKIRNRWDHIRLLPAGEQEKLDAVFSGYMQIFDDHKVERLVKQKQEEEDNLSIKLLILEKMEKFFGTVDEKSDWKELDKKLAEFVRQFRKIGRIPAEKNQETWDRFHAAQDQFHTMRFKYDKKYRQDIEKYLSKKKKLVDEAEALIDADDLPKAARKVNKLHRQWKKTGNLPQKDENELWDRFKAATDAFNEKKSDNLELLKDQEDENYEQKVALIKQAKELKESEEWDETHKAFQRLMDKWKAIGPVPRRKSGKIWKDFKGAMDHFYDRRREFFKEVKEERKDNLKEKEGILDQLSELKTHENPIEALEIAKPLQAEFKKAGYVPIKHKNRLWREYREICDVIYDRFRATKSAAQIVGKENVEHYTTDDLADIKRKQDMADKLRKEVGRLGNELIQMKESLSYFKPSGKGSSLLDDVRSRIDKAEQELNKKEEKLQNLEIEIDKIKRDS
jgi:hypothetical protein